MSLMNLMNRVLGFQAGPDKPLISLVMLLDNPREMDDERVRVSAGVAWAKHYGASDESSTVVGEPPTYVVSSRDRSFVITNQSGLYVKDMQKATRHVASEAVRRAFMKHRAWLSVDLLRPQNPEGTEFVECMGLLGKLAAELVEDDCLVLISPHTNQMRLCDLSLKDKLSSANPFDSFRDLPAEIRPEENHAPPVSLEAQRRWPEFLDAFRQRQSGQLFSVKAMISDGKLKERVWIRVYNINGEKIAGLIDSHPSRLTDLKQGDRVWATSSEISDWMFVKQGNLVGGFSERIMAGHPHP